MSHPNITYTLKRPTPAELREGVERAAASLEEAVRRMSQVQFEQHEGLVQFAVDMEVAYDLENVNEAALEQFIKDGGEPWDIYKTETAFLGAPLGRPIRD